MLNPKLLLMTERVFIPNCLMTYQGLSPSAKLVFAKLAQLMNADSTCNITQQELAEETGTSKTRINTILKELEKESFIKIEGSDKYILIWHKLFESAIK